MDSLAELMGNIVSGNDGKIVKFIGDAALIVFNGEDADRGTQTLLKLKTQVDAWFRTESINSQLRIQAHFGSAVCGPFGTESDKKFDLFGDAVNTAATLKSYGIAITPQLFRKLEPETRKQFKKHTPPVRYISVDERHKD